MEQTRKEYTIQFKFRKDDGWNGYSIKPCKTLEEAQRELRLFMQKEARERAAGKSVAAAGHLGLVTERCSDYDVVAFRIREREITPWNTVQEELAE